MVINQQKTWLIADINSKERAKYYKENSTSIQNLGFAYQLRSLYGYKVRTILQFQKLTEKKQLNKERKEKKAYIVWGA